MTNKILSLGFGFGLALAAVLPAAAATAPAPAHQTSTMASTAKSHHVYYYVSRNAHGKGCEIVNHRPSHKMMVGKYYYGSHKAASQAMMADKVCHA